MDKHKRVVRVVDMDGALDAADEFLDAARPTNFRAAARYEEPPVFKVIRETFGICPAAFQWDEITGRAIEIANSYPDSKVPPDRYDRRSLMLAQLAAAEQSAYYHSKIPKSSDKKVREGKR